MPISEARENFAEVVNRAVDGGEPTALRPAKEERESGAEPVPWEQVKAGLGL